MNRAAELFRAAADAATIAAAPGHKPGEQSRYARAAEEAAYAGIEALFEASLGQRPDFFAVACAIVDERRAAA